MTLYPPSAGRSSPMRTSPQLDLTPGFCFAAAVMLLTVPLKWCAAFLFAAAFHELCHIAAVCICGGHIPVIRIGVGGAMMHAPFLSPTATLLCTLAGPLGGFLLLLLSEYFPRLAVCAAMQSLFNLLPLISLDGGLALRCVFLLLLPSAIVERLCRSIHRCVMILGIAVGIYATFILKLGFLPLVAAVILLIKGKEGKIPCK